MEINESIDQLKDLLNRIILCQGITGDITEKLNMEAISFPDEIGVIGPGSKVKIEWQDGMFDDGFVFTLPTMHPLDILQDGIVMCPNPNDANDPVWIPIQSLSNNPLVKKIDIFKK